MTEETKNTLIMTVGIPRSGKSTWARKQGHPIVSPDAIRLSIHGQAFIPAAEHLVWAIAHQMVHALFLAGHDTVILDATNATKKRRYEWLHHLWRRKYASFPTNIETCVERALEAGREDLVLIIRNMAEKIEFPDIRQEIVPTKEAL